MRRFATTFGILAAGLRQREERAKAEPLFGFTWLETWNEEVRSMVELGIGPDGRFDGDSYGDGQRSNGVQPILSHACCVGGSQGDCGDCGGRRSVRITINEANEDLPVAGRVRSVGRSVELDAELWRLLVSA